MTRQGSPRSTRSAQRIQPTQARAVALARDPQPGDYDDVIGDVEPQAYGAAFSDGRAIPERLRALVEPSTTDLTSAAMPGPEPDPLAGRPAAVALSVRVEADTLRRLRALAAVKGTKYQTLLKAFVQERLYEEEQREGLVRRRREPRETATPLPK